MVTFTSEDAEHTGAYEPAAYPAFAVTVDVVYFTIRDGELCVLLVERGVEPFKGKWALPGGFVRPDENADEAALRELGEEAGIVAGHLEQLATYSDPDRDPRMRVVSIAYVALAADTATPTGGTDATAAAFWPVSELRLGGRTGREVAFDHAAIITDGVERVRAKFEYTTLATEFCGPTFTIAALRGIYEVVWGVALDPPNFHRKVLSSPDFVTAVTAVTEPAGSRGGRPAQMYRCGGARSIQPPLHRPTVSPTQGTST